MLKVCWGLRVEMRSGISADLDLNTHGRENTRRISRCAWFCCSNWRGQRDRRSWIWKQGARGVRCVAAVTALRMVRRAHLLNCVLSCAISPTHLSLRGSLWIVLVESNYSVLVLFAPCCRKKKYPQTPLIGTDAIRSRIEFELFAHVSSWSVVVFLWFKLDHDLKCALQEKKFKNVFVWW